MKMGFSSIITVRVALFIEYPVQSRECDLCVDDALVDCGVVSSTIADG